MKPKLPYSSKDPNLANLAAALLERYNRLVWGGHLAPIYGLTTLVTTSNGMAGVGIWNGVKVFWHLDPIHDTFEVEVI